MRGLIVLLSALALSACTSPERKPSVAFFYWKNRFALTAEEAAFLDSTNCRTLYIKFLDIARDEAGTVRPYTLLEVADTLGCGGRTLIPCVFLTNSVFVAIKPDEIEALARKTALALENVGQQFPQPSFSEVQLDCDWTERTREAFFLFSKKIKRYLPPSTRVSATLRLHQYKFPQRTGVPPVDRALLMLYNTGNIHDPNEVNSIFQPGAALRYVQGVPQRYPLPLDVALPAFAWTLVYREGYLWKIGPEHYTPPPYDGVQHIRTEVVDTTLLRKAAAVAALLPLASDARVAFFRLDSTTVRRYPAAFLKEMCQKAAQQGAVK